MRSGIFIGARVVVLLIGLQRRSVYGRVGVDTTEVNPILYRIAKRALFMMNPETAHEFTLASLRMAQGLGVLRLLSGKPVDDPVEVMGLKFPTSSTG